MKRLLPLIRFSQTCRNMHVTPPIHMTIPLVIDNDGRVERVYDIYSRLLKDRIVCVMSEINDQVASSVIAQLLFLQGESSKSIINMYINSPGGSVTAGLGIYDTMQYISAPIATWCIGQAASMGSLLLCAGRKNMRYSLPNSRIMVHQPSGGAQGQATDILIRAEEIKRLRTRIERIYAHHTGQDIKTIEKVLDRDYFMDATEAKEFGLIDKIEASSDAT